MSDTPNFPAFLHQMPAFPGQYDHGQGCIESWVGMSLRDYFAAKAMLMQFGTETQTQLADHAYFCYQMADAMLAAREVKP